MLLTLTLDRVVAFQVGHTFSLIIIIIYYNIIIYYYYYLSIPEETMISLAFSHALFGGNPVASYFERPLENLPQKGTINVLRTLHQRGSSQSPLPQ